MGSGSAARSEEIIEESFVKETCPDELKALMDFLEANEEDLDNFAREITYCTNPLEPVTFGNNNYVFGIVITHT